MSRERLYLFDTTLRDGAQTNGVDFTLSDKLAIIGCSTASASTTSKAVIPAAIRSTRALLRDALLNTTFTAFGMTRRPGRSTSNDPGLAALLEAKAEAICFVAKSWDYHVRSRSRPRLKKISPRSATACAPQSPRAARCCSTASISSTATRPILPTRWPAPKPPTRRARAGSCCATPTAARCRTRSRRSSARWSKPCPAITCRHPCPQRHRAGGGEFVRRGARRRAADPGHAQWPRRALRQRQSRLDHPDAEAQAGIRRKSSRSACPTSS